MARYLIIKTSSFGDVVQSFSVAEYLKQKDPTCSIDWVVEKSIGPLVRAHPHIDRVIEIEAKKWKKALFQKTTYREIKAFQKNLQEYAYDAVFDLQGNAKSGLIAFFARSGAKIGFDWKSAPERINCFFSTDRFNPPHGQNIRRDYLFLPQSYFQDFSQDFFKKCSEKVLLRLSHKEVQELQSYEKKLQKNSWMICPSSNWQNKQISFDTLEKFLFSCHKEFQPFFVFIWASDAEKKLAESLIEKFPHSMICDKLSLPLLQHIMKKMQLVIAMDSFPLHLAGTTNTPTYSMFGPSVSYKYKPLGSEHFSYQGNCPYNYSFEKRCPVLRTCSTGACLKDAAATDLFVPFSEWYKQIQKI